MDSRLLDLLVCPICKGPLQYDAAAQELICPRDRLAYPIRDGIPLMLVDLARDMTLPAETTQSPAATAEPAA
ncbi:MAG: Trm112 family protein [Thiomonas sp.]|uniref:Trm112 family protein n=1 Tax=Thiomonas sp. TaxID=2047785 RepID=UPI002A36F429|nr:Trm112 family protein [Thiomonas sp.]MDY0331074.1 Trm112 family protein [Thiomonas sp.]